ncbi:kinase-like protein [Auriscalpium vulgare]|uniref:Kinase-like protein n=1 Tax=Auriscalpium vulgare TaxID=40419 RepID=A0ACB8RRW0_9AGAM|nr:kinase-like protein [Auriscalpium vulgare]
MLPPPPPGLVFNFDGVDLNNLSSVTSPQVLKNLFNARKIGYVDYITAIRALQSPSAAHVSQSASVQVLYPETARPPIAPQAVLQLLASPLPRSSQHIASTQIHRISDSFLVKYGPFVNALEAKTMKFVQEHTTIPVPTVHLVFISNGKTYIVMDYIPGADVQHLWPSLSSSQRQSIVAQVAHYLHELRDITPQSSIPGPIAQGLCYGRWFPSYGAGPFQSHSQLVEWWNRELDAAVVPTGRQGVEADCDRLRADSPLVFTHGDLLPRNIIFCRDKLWVVDWELQVLSSRDLGRGLSHR